MSTSKTRQVKRVVLDRSTFEELRFMLQANAVYFIGGGQSMFVPKHGAKYLLNASDEDGQSTLCYWPNDTGEKVEMTYGEVARVELKRAFPNLKRVGWKRPMVKYFDKQVPIACFHRYQGELIFTDLKAAYWQIYRHLWLNTCHPRGMGTLPLWDLAEKLQNIKPARNAIMGTIRARQAIAWKGFEPIYLKVKNPYLSPGLWITVMNILHDIAGLAYLTGAIYVATDGYFHPVERSYGATLFQTELASAGLDYRTEVNNGQIRGWANYKFGEKETYLFKRGYQSSRFMEFSNLTNENSGQHYFNWFRKVKDYGSH